MKMPCKVSLLMILLGCIGMVFLAEADELSPPIGMINLEVTSVAAGIGFSWGAGWLSFQGKEYPLTVEGADLAAVGISKMTAMGEVYNLTQAADIEGSFVKAEAGIAIARGIKGCLAKNEKGVVINLRATQKGLCLNLGLGGFNITMK
jgi:hypothetical protein